VGTATGSASSPLYNLEQNIAGLLCWLPLGPVPILASIFFLVAAPYKNNKFIRFHATQSIFTVVGLVAAGVAFMIFSSILTLIFPPLQDYVIKPIWWAYSLAVLALYLYMSYKAYSGDSPRLPYVGEMAAKHAGV
jgi:uncharacterized membrane protein